MNDPSQNPWSALQRLSEDLNQLLGEGARPAVGARRGAAAEPRWTPPVDIREDKERYVILADLPGVEAGDIEITMDSGVLDMRGERRPEERTEGYRRLERARGTFHRRFSLPDSADPESITASSRHGVVEISITKRRAPKPRRIQVAG